MTDVSLKTDVEEWKELHDAVKADESEEYEEDDDEDDHWSRVSDRAYEETFGEEE